MMMIGRRQIILGDVPFCDGVERRLRQRKEARARVAAVQSRPLRKRSGLSYEASRGCVPLQCFYGGEES